MYPHLIILVSQVTNVINIQLGGRGLTMEKIEVRCRGLRWTQSGNILFVSWLYIRVTIESTCKPLKIRFVFVCLPPYLRFGKDSFLNILNKRITQWMNEWIIDKGFFFFIEQPQLHPVCYLYYDCKRQYNL